MRAFLLRPCHFFISYSHKDSAFAKELKNWLKETAGLEVWFDQMDLRSGERVQANIAASISQCQGIIFVLSENSLKSKFVQDELDQALAEKKDCQRFQIVLLRLDDCDIAGQWKAVRQLKWHELATPAGPQLSLHAATEILCRIHAYDGWQSRQGELNEVYVSGGWRKGEETFADETCRCLAVHGLRLVGDLPSHRGPTDPQRIAAIMRACWGHLLVLPRRNHDSGPAAAYKHFLQERDLSAELGLPRAAFVQPDCTLPPVLAEEAIVVHPEMLADTSSAAADRLRSHIYDFVESLLKPRHEVHAFFASEYEGNEERNALARAIVEATGTLPCYWGKDYREWPVSKSIKDAITSARFVVADLTSLEPSPNSPIGSARVNVNACIEAAIAWGANVTHLCFAAENPHAALGPLEGKTKHVPFMFREAQLKLYADSVPSLAPGVQFLGAVHKAVLDDRKRYGRRVINYELEL